MKKELSSLEIGYLIKEFDYLINSKIDTVSNNEKDIFLNLFVPSKGKKILRIMPNFIYIAERKDVLEKPSGFCMFLRKYLINSRIRKIKQIDSERIIEMLFETKEEKYILIIELFSKGNIILCKEDYTIVGLKEQQVWKDRELKPNLKYKTPIKKENFFEINEKKLNTALNSDKTLVKKLAIDLGFGGVYSEELCNLSSIEKDKIKLEDREIKKLCDSIKKIISKQIKAQIVYDCENILDVVPFSLRIYENHKNKDFQSYNESLNFFMENYSESSEKNEKTKTYNKKIQQLEKTLDTQNNNIKEIEEYISEYEKKAELIYSNYNLIKEIVETIKKANEKYDWNEIKIKLKGHSIIKELNTKDKKIILELN